jgi:DNA-binding CsgD family transcriptional regulator
MPKADRLVATIGAIHAAGLDETLWPQALRGVAELCGGVGATFEIIDKIARRHRGFQAVGVPLSLEEKYLAYWALRNPRVNHCQRLHTGEVGWDYQFIDERGMDRDGFYSELLPITDFRYFVSGTVLNSPTEHVVVAVQRARRQGHVSEAGIGMMRLLVPHLQQAFDVATRLKGASQPGRLLEGALDWLNDGAALVRRDGYILYCNTSLRQIAARNDGVRIERGALAFTTGTARSVFEGGLAALARLGDARRIGCEFLAPRAQGRPAYVVALRPLAVEPAAVTVADAVAIVFIRDPMTRNEAAANLLRDLFGLTPAETALALALQAGVTPAAYARDRRLSANTVYTHLRRIKDKTGWHRTSQLSRKLNELQVPSRHK